jgi:preprotein translocase subunit SecE
VAESKRRGEDAVDEDLNEVLDDAVRDDALIGRARRGRAVRADKVDDTVDTDVAPDRRDGKAPAKAAKGESDKPSGKAKAATGADEPGISSRLGRFIREIVAELKKVIWPSRKELLTYTTVVVVFVAVILAIVGLLDLGFAKAVLFVFGGQK